MRKLVRIVVGFALVIAGLVLALPGVPGPGLLIALAGLVLLSEYFRWARRITNWVRRRAGEVRDRVRGPKQGG